MIKKFLFYKNVFYTKSKFHIYVLDTNDYSSILLLENPRLIYYPFKNHASNIKAKTVNEAVLTNIRDVQQESFVNFSNKLEKKSKTNIRANNAYDDSDFKKNKGKLRKKDKNQMDLNVHEMFTMTESFISDSVQSQDKDVSLTKNNRNRQKLKSKKDVVNTYFNSTSSSYHTKDDSKLNKQIVLDSPLTIKQLSVKLNRPEAAIITWLFLKGISVTINQVVDTSIAIEVAKHYGFVILDSLNNTFSKSQAQDDLSLLSNQSIQSVSRPPIVTIFGHVDHGKTTLLDCICKTNLVQSEVGGITQSIKGYEVEFDSSFSSAKEKLIFLDTPGHEAFISMRLRGANVTDLAVLVVAADDGLQPQSIEAIRYILDRRIPYIVAINKVDKEHIDINKVRQQLADYKVLDKRWGGSSQIIEISALKALNVDILLSALWDLANEQSLRANLDVPAQGTVLEACLDKKMGVIASLVVKNGVLNMGDIVVAGTVYGRVKVIIDSYNCKVNQAFPSAIVNVLGFSATPQAGLKFCVVLDDRDAKSLVNKNIKDENNLLRVSNKLNTRVTLGSYDSTSKLKIVNIILKADTQGSLDALVNSFGRIPQEKVQINLLVANCGSVSNKDVELAITSQSMILGFNITTSSNLRHFIEKSKVLVRTFSIIYRLLDYVQEYMLSLVEPEYKRLFIGKAVVKTVFSVNKGTVAGCMVNSGKVKQNAKISVYQDQSLLYDGKIDSLKHLKDDVEEVVAGNECGLMCHNYHAWQSSDIIEVYQLIEKPKVL